MMVLQSEAKQDEFTLANRLNDAYEEIEKHKRSNRKLNRFIVERGLAEEYIAWIIANRITTGEE